MTSEYTEQDRHNENCCWTWPRDQCPGDGCRCVCHMSGEPVRTTYFDLLKEIEGYRQRSRDEDTARIRLNHARIEAEERAAKAEAERDDLVARLAAAEAALVAYADLIDYKPFMEFERAFNSILDNESAPSEPDERERWLIRQAWVAAMNVAHDALAGSREQAQGEGRDGSR